MILTVLETAFQKLQPKETFSRNFKNFELKKFKNYIKTKMKSMDKQRTFEKEFLEVLNSFVPLKKTFVRANNTIAIMKWSQLEIEYLRMSTVENIKIYKTPKNHCRKSYKKERINLFQI